jgi:hypothetical protein
MKFFRGERHKAFLTVGDDRHRLSPRFVLKPNVALKLGRRDDRHGTISILHGTLDLPIIGDKFKCAAAELPTA